MALMRSSLVTGSLLAAATLGSACVVSVDSQAQIMREEKRYTVSGTPELRLTTFDGAIEIQSWEKPDVAIDIEKRGSTKEAVDGLEIVRAERQPHRARGQAAALGIAQRLRVPGPDRMYSYFTLWQKATSTGAHLLGRTRGNALLAVEKVLEDGSYLSRIYPSEQARRRRKDGIVVRVIEYELETVEDAEHFWLRSRHFSSRRRLRTGTRGPLSPALGNRRRA